jgi:methyl-accepting chemotaxis protein
LVSLASKGKREAADKKVAAEREEAARKAALKKRADEFEPAIGDIVDTVSSASTELEASAVDRFLSTVRAA